MRNSTRLTRHGTEDFQTHHPQSKPITIKITSILSRLSKKENVKTAIRQWFTIVRQCGMIARSPNPRRMHSLEILKHQSPFAVVLQMWIVAKVKSGLHRRLGDMRSGQVTGEKTPPKHRLILVVNVLRLRSLLVIICFHMNEQQFVVGLSSITMQPVDRLQNQCIHPGRLLYSLLLGTGKEGDQGPPGR
jgi:hypothetical protein